MAAALPYDAIVVIDMAAGRVTPQSLEVIAFADGITPGGAQKVLLALVGKEVTASAPGLAAQFGRDVMVCDHDGFFLPNPELLRLLLHEIVADTGVDCVCFPHTMSNCQVASALAVDFSGTAITAVQSHRQEDDGISFQRAVCNGKLVQSVQPSPTAPAFLTILPGTYAKNTAAAHTTRSGTVFRKEPAVEVHSYQPLAMVRNTEGSADLEEADVIISVGRGIGSRENLHLIEELASLFPHAATGSSRPLCDLRWVPFSRQIGITGKTVAPRLYLACGISGAQQHLAGMKGAQCVVAINKDPNAAIFSVADYIIVEDIISFIPQLIKTIGDNRYGHSLSGKTRPGQFCR